jgi:hypothetical protein
MLSTNLAGSESGNGILKFPFSSDSVTSEVPSHRMLTIGKAFFCAEASITLPVKLVCEYAVKETMNSENRTRGLITFIGLLIDLTPSR